MRLNQYKFPTIELTLAAGVVAGVCGSRGGRVTVLYTVVEITEEQQVLDPKDRFSGTTTIYPLMPVGIRFCAGHDLTNQPFVDVSRLNTALTPPMVIRLGGLFHVAPTDKMCNILKFGLQSGRKIAENEGYAMRGREDIHMNILPPHLVGSQKLKKLKVHGHVDCIVISLCKTGLKPGEARLNQQGFVLQSATIEPKHIDYIVNYLLASWFRL